MARKRGLLPKGANTYWELFVILGFYLDLDMESTLVYGSLYDSVSSLCAD